MVKNVKSYTFRLLLTRNLCKLTKSIEMMNEDRNKQSFIFSNSSVLSWHFLLASFLLIFNRKQVFSSMLEKPFDSLSLYKVEYFDKLKKSYLYMLEKPRPGLLCSFMISPLNDGHPLCSFASHQILSLALSATFLPCLTKWR